MSDIPRWLLEQEGITTRQWKAKKRRELKAIIIALDAFLTGCAYTPLRNGEVGNIGTLLMSMQRQLSVKEWGR